MKPASVTRLDDPILRSRLYGDDKKESFSTFNSRLQRNLKYVNTPRKPGNMSERIFHVGDRVYAGNLMLIA